MQEQLKKNKERGLKMNVSYKVNTSAKIQHCHTLRDLLSFVQFENRENYPWRSVTFSKIAG